MYIIHKVHMTYTHQAANDHQMSVIFAVPWIAWAGNQPIRRSARQLQRRHRVPCAERCAPWSESVRMNPTWPSDSHVWHAVSAAAAVASFEAPGLVV